MSNNSELHGWDDIARFLGVSRRTAQTYESEYGLPVRRMRGTKGRVWALSAEIEAWKTLRPVQSAIAETPGKPQTEIVSDTDQHGPATQTCKDAEPVSEVEIALNTAQTAATKSQVLVSHPKKMVRWSAGLLASLLMLFAGYGIWTSQSLHLGPADFRIDGCNLIAVDTKGHELWRHAFRYRLVDSLYRPENMYQHAWLGDLDGDGRHEIVFLKHVENESGSDTAVLCFGPGGTVRWQFTPGRAVDDASGDHMVPPYFASSIEVIKGIHPDDTRIAVSSIHYMAQPDQVAILNASGRLLGEYWHPGHISHLAQAELDGNRRKELLLGGVNNGDHQATLVVLDPFHIIGRTTPTQMSDHRFALTHMQPAHEEAVVLFPRSCISYGQPYTRVCVLRVTPSRILVHVAEGAAENYAGFVYELDHELHVVSVSPTDIRVPQLHEELRLRGILDHHFSMAAECERLKSAVIVHRET